MNVSRARVAARRNEPLPPGRPSTSWSPATDAVPTGCHPGSTEVNGSKRTIRWRASVGSGSQASPT